MWGFGEMAFSEGFVPAGHETAAVSIPQQETRQALLLLVVVVAVTNRGLSCCCCLALC